MRILNREADVGAENLQAREIERERVAPYFPAALMRIDYCFVPKSGSKKLVIYFSGIGKSNGKFDFWKTGLAVEENALFLSDSCRGWYQLGIAGFGDSIERTTISILGIDTERTAAAMEGGCIF